MWQTYPPPAAIAQNKKFPKLPEGRKIIENEEPKKRIRKYIGVSSPQRGHTAKIPEMKTAHPAIDITGISCGRSTSKSISRFKKQGPYIDIYSSTEIRKPVHPSAILRKNELTSGLSHNWRKKFVL